MTGRIVPFVNASCQTPFLALQEALIMPLPDPIGPDGPVDPTGIVRELTIYINARSLLWSDPNISFEQVVEQWNEFDPTRRVLDNLPLITWKNSAKSGILYPGESTQAVDGLSFTIDATYLA